MRRWVRSIVRHRRLAAGVGAAALLLGLLFVPGIPATYRARARLILRESPFPEAPADLPLSPARWPRGTSLDLVRSDAVLRRAAAGEYQSFTPDRIRSMISVTRETDSNTVAVECAASSASVAAGVAKAVTHAFAAEAAARRREEAAQALAQVERALAERARIQAELATLLRAISPGSSDVAADPVEHATRQRLAELERAQAADRVEIDSLAVQIDVLSQRLERGEVGPPKPLRTADSDRLAAELEQARARLEELRDAPEASRQAARVDRLREERARALAREALEARFAPVRDLIEDLRERTARREALQRLTPQREAQMADLRASLRKLLDSRPERGGDPQRRSEVEARLAWVEDSKKNLEALRGRLASERDLADRVVERVEDPAGASGSYGRLILLLAASLLLALVVPPAADALTPVVRTEYDVRRTVNLPLLGTVPRVQDARLAAGPGPIADLFAVMAALVERRARDESVKCLALTSGGPGEGKSAVAGNLAAALARSGARTLLMDADLRRPAQHGLFGVANEAGLSSFLQGSADPVDGAIVATGVEGLSLLPAGPPLENAVAFFRSDRFFSMLVDLRTKFDLILLDLPPVLRTADGLVAAPAVDGVILLLEADATRKEDVTEAKRRVRGAGGKLFGCVLNKAAAPARGYYYYYSEAPPAGAETEAGTPAG